MQHGAPGPLVSLPVHSHGVHPQAGQGADIGTAHIASLVACMGTEYEYRDPQIDNEYAYTCSILLLRHKIHYSSLSIVQVQIVSFRFQL